MYFIQEADKPKLISKIFLIPTLDQNKIILPINYEETKNNKKIDNKKKEIKREIILVKRTINILNKTHCKKVILSKQMQNRELFCNQLYTQGFKVIDGRWLFTILSEEVIQYAIKTNKMIEEKTKISILVNDLTDIVLENIKNIAKKYKRINIVTNHIEKLKRLEEELLEEYGVMITLNNNKKKSLTKADIILNFDFSSELINKYRIAEKAIVINLKGNIKIKQKRFEGKIFNDYEITHKETEDFEYNKNEKYLTKDIYEALIYKHQPIENIMKKIKKDKVKISELK